MFRVMLEERRVALVLTVEHLCRVPVPEFVNELLQHFESLVMHSHVCSVVPECLSKGIVGDFQLSYFFILVGCDCDECGLGKVHL